MPAAPAQLLEGSLGSAGGAVVPEEQLYLEVVREPSVLLDRVWVDGELGQLVVTEVSKTLLVLHE